MEQEMKLGTLLEQNRGLMINGVLVLHRREGTRHWFTTVEEHPNRDMGYLGFNPEQTVKLIDQNNASVGCYDKSGNIIGAMQLTFRPQPWTFSQMFNGPRGGAERRMNTVSNAWEVLLLDLKFTPAEMEVCLMRYNQIYGLDNFLNRADMVKRLTSNEMSAEDFALGLKVIALRYLPQSRLPNLPEPSNHVRVALNIALTAADTILLDDRRAMLENRKDGKLVLIHAHHLDRLYVDTYEFDSNLVVELDDGATVLRDVSDNLHRLQLRYTVPLDANRVAQASKMLATAVDGIPRN